MAGRGKGEAVTVWPANALAVAPQLRVPWYRPAGAAAGPSCQGSKGDLAPRKGASASLVVLVAVRLGVLLQPVDEGLGGLTHLRKAGNIDTGWSGRSDWDTMVSAASR